MKSLFRVVPALLACALVVPVLGLVAPPGTAIPAAAAAVRQSGRTTLLPPVVQPGARVASADDALLVGTVTFHPARRGRKVEIQRRVGSRPWERVAVKRQNRAGVVTFTAAARNGRGRPYTYRGVARDWGALGRKASRPQSAAVWVEKFSDEFSGPTLDLTRWEYRQVGVYTAASNRACSASSPDAVEVRGGRVLLSVMADEVRDATGPCVGQDKMGRTLDDNTYWYRNGHIGTQHGIDGRFRYGVAAARVKFDRHVGAHGSFWLQSTVRDLPDAGPEKDGAEIDVVEYFGENYRQGDVHHCVHYWDAAGVHHKVPEKSCVARRARRALGAHDDWFRKYHVFSVEWTPKAYTFRVDGIKTRTVTEGVSRVPEYLILSTLSSGWEVGKVDRTTLPNATQVDWVRFWQK